MNWTQAEYPVGPWDSDGLPPRRMDERCQRHAHCAYRDDDPAYCPACHRSIGRGCGCLSDPGENIGQNAAHTAGTRRPDWVACGKCGDRWTGLAACHCATCHRTFTGVTAFDKHRKGTYEPDTRHCVDPATTGLVPIKKQHWSGWGWPGEDPRRGE